MDNTITVYKSGPLEVYWLTHPEILYWFDKQLGCSYGPFKTVDAAIEHYNWRYQVYNRVVPFPTKTASNVENKENIIRIDFKQRKRVVIP